jgi:putative PIN family toxin of toxin-antitoxin system
LLYRAVLDTNVLISAILFGGKPQRALEVAIKGEYSLYISETLIEELRNVLLRPKFGFGAQTVEIIIAELIGVAELVDPSNRINVISEDTDDDRILECAVESRAHFIVTGDSHLLALVEYLKIKIIEPDQFLKIISFQEQP